jgi:hypothetical protein
MRDLIESWKIKTKKTAVFHSFERRLSMNYLSLIPVIVLIGAFVHL